jgi:hypothetical protein
MITPQTFRGRFTCSGMQALGFQVRQPGETGVGKAKTIKSAKNGRIDQLIL